MISAYKRVRDVLDFELPDPDNPNYTSDSAEELFNKMQTELIRYSTNSEQQSYAIPDTVTTIDKSTFGVPLI